MPIERSSALPATPRTAAPPVLVLLLAVVFGPVGVLSGPAAAETPAPGPGDVRYAISLAAPQTQMVDIAVRFPLEPGPGGELDVHLPTWRIGRYSILDFAGQVRGEAARLDDGTALPIAKVRKSTWRVDVPAGAAAVTVAYRVYANEGGIRTRHVDETHAFLSGTSVFLYSEAHRDRPCTVVLEDVPAGWRVACGLDPIDPADPHRLRAADYDELVDAPIEVGLHDRWTFEAVGVRHEVVLWPPGLDVDPARITGDFRAIVETQHAIFGELPYDHYLFLLHAGIGGGGTEHFNSTIMLGSIETFEASVGNRPAWKRFLGLASHELFHAWNVKALRPAGLVPYDYQSENYTTLLWVVEGTTSYYDDLTLARAGLMTPKAYLERVGRTIDAYETRPGAAVQSVSASSFDAWIKFNHRSPDDVNSEVSFYSKGALVSLYLDLLVREATGNASSLDEVMRRMYQRFPLETGGYDEADLVATLEAVAGRPMAEPFERFVDGTEPIPWDAVLGVVGLELHFDAADDPRLASADSEADADGDPAEGTGDDGGPEEAATAEPIRLRADLGVSLGSDGGRAVVRSVRSDGPAYEAGVLPGDELIAIDGRRASASGLEETLRIRFRPEQTVELLLIRRDHVLRRLVRLAGVPDGSWELRRVNDPTDAQRAAWEDWLGQPWPEG